MTERCYFTAVPQSHRVPDERRHKFPPSLFRTGQRQVSFGMSKYFIDNYGVSLLPHRLRFFDSDTEFADRNQSLELGKYYRVYYQESDGGGIVLLGTIQLK